MKKIILLLTILLTANFSFATSPLNPNNFQAIVALDAKLCEDSTLSLEARISNCGNLIFRANAKISELKSQTPVSVANSVIGCQKISQTLWEGMSDKEDEIPKMGVNSTTAGDVSGLQFFLNKLGYLGYLPDSDVKRYPYEDSKYDKYITQAVKKLQAKHNIKQTGSVGPQTLVKINSMICGDTIVQKNVIDTGKFIIELPIGWVYTPKQGTDSFVGEFANGKEKFTFDFGRYGGRIQDPPQDGHTDKFYLVNGRRVQASHESTSKASYYSVYIETSNPNLEVVENKNGLRIGGENLSQNGRSLLLNSIKTINFK